MKRSVLALFLLTGALVGGFALVGETDASGPPHVAEEWIDANHMRVRVDGRWRDVPLIPLADHMCRSNNRMFKQYCAGPR